MSFTVRDVSLFKHDEFRGVVSVALSNGKCCLVGFKFWVSFVGERGRWTIAAGSPLSIWFKRCEGDRERTILVSGKSWVPEIFCTATKLDGGDSLVVLFERDVLEDIRSRVEGNRVSVGPFLHFKILGALEGDSGYEELLKFLDDISSPLPRAAYGCFKSAYRKCVRESGEDCGVLSDLLVEKLFAEYYTRTTVNELFHDSVGSVSLLVPVFKQDGEECLLWFCGGEYDHGVARLRGASKPVRLPNRVVMLLDSLGWRDCGDLCWRRGLYGQQCLRLDC